jgi:predicted Zn finger-like uncharacterized protein
MPSYSCPECGAVIKSANPIPAGKKVKCPKCATVFPVAAKEQAAAPAKPKAAAGKVPAAGAKSPKTSAPPKKAAPPKPLPKAREEEDDDGKAYIFQTNPRAEEEEEDKEELQVVPPAIPPDPRRVAAAIVTVPAKWLLASGLVSCVAGLIAILLGLFPLLFSEHLVKIEDAAKDEQGKPVDKEWKDLTEEQKAQVREAEKEPRLLDFVKIGVGILFMIYGGFICVGAFKMQFMESYAWSMAGSIMAMIPGLDVWLFTLPMGYWCLNTLRKPVVKEGFEAEKAAAKRYGG